MVQAIRRMHTSTYTFFPRASSAIPTFMIVHGKLGFEMPHVRLPRLSVYAVLQRDTLNLGSVCLPYLRRADFRIGLNLSTRSHDSTGVV